MPWLGRFGTSDLHRTAALTGTGLVVAHVGSLYFDPFAQLKLVDFVFPFLGATSRSGWAWARLRSTCSA